MCALKIEALRNIGIIAHIDAGKTTLTERMLFYTHTIHRMGEVHDGAATMDFMPEEQERGITIAAACTSCRWQDGQINIIDTPGHVDFTIEVERALRVLDGAVGVFCAVAGVEPQSETVWRQSEQFATPKLAFINKMDRAGANFTATLEAMRTRLNTKPLPLTIPIGAEEHFCGVIDLIEQQALFFSPEDQGSTVIRQSLSPEHQALAHSWREALLEGLAEVDDQFCDAYLNGAVSDELIRPAIRRATLRQAITPVFAGSALGNIGVQPLLDGVVAYLPSPLDAKPPLGHSQDGQHTQSIAPDPKAPLLGLVFKVLVEGGRSVCFVRLYAGTLREGDVCLISGLGHEERVQRIYRLHADSREQIPLAEAGDIVAVIGLRRASTGSTIASPQRPLLLESIHSQAPVISLALEVRNAGESATLDEALARFCAEDPTLSVVLDEATGHRILSGMGELHLDVVLERITREYRVSPRSGQPQVICRESIRDEAEAEAVFDKELGKERHHGAVRLRLAPAPRGNGNSISFAMDTQTLPQTFVQAARAGLEEALCAGALGGYPVDDVRVSVLAMGREEARSTAPGFHMAAAMALREALHTARPVLLEPIMLVELSVPEEWLGGAISLFVGKGGKVEQLDERAGLKHVAGFAPLSRLFGFSTALRSATQGRAGLIMRFERFDSV